MERRIFLKQAAITAASLASARNISASAKTPSNPIAKRTLGKTGEKLSMIGFGGIVVMNEEPGAAANIVAEAVDRGINYFDVAPSYGDAQERLGPALAPYRENCFLACKTEGRMKDDSRAQLEQSLKLLKTDHVDLYQFHALTKMAELDKVLGPGGAMETMEAAKKEGKIRYIGFSVHSVETALGILCLKSMAKTVWPADEKKEHPEPKCWYQPAAFPNEASLGLRWTLGHPITAAIPPGDEKYFRLAMDVAQNYKPLEPQEEQALLSGGAGLEPIFQLGNDV
jgi:hypothetical protein